MVSRGALAEIVDIIGYLLLKNLLLSFHFGVNYTSEIIN
jgi:hypothetical protein